MGKYNFFNPYRYGVHQKIIDYVGKQKTVLDVGCAEGALSEKMLLNQCEIVGIEFNKLSAQTAKNYCKEVILGDIEFIELTKEYDNYFDFVIFADVLEHLKEPLNAINKFKSYLKDDGFFIISVPNISNWRMRMKFLFGNFQYEDHGLLDKTHLRFFNYKSTKKLISDAGLEIVNFDVTMNGVNKFAKFFYLLCKLWPNLFAYQFLIVAKIETRK